MSLHRTVDCSCDDKASRSRRTHPPKRNARSRQIDCQGRSSRIATCVRMDGRHTSTSPQSAIRKEDCMDQGSQPPPQDPTNNLRRLAQPRRQATTLHQGHPPGRVLVVASPRVSNISRTFFPTETSQTTKTR